MRRPQPQQLGHLKHKTVQSGAVRAHPMTASGKFTGPKHAGVAIDLAPDELTSDRQLIFVSPVAQNIHLLYQISLIQSTSG